MTHTVHCSKLDKDLPGLTEPPFPGRLGQLIYENVSQEAWDDWNDNIQIRVLNEYRLNMSDEHDYQTLLGQMCLYLNLKREEINIENS